MPSYKNSFRSPDHIEETIVDEKGSVVGTIRIKLSNILWKPKGQQKFYSISLDQFKNWITDKNTRTKRTSS